MSLDKLIVSIPSLAAGTAATSLYGALVSIADVGIDPDGEGTMVLTIPGMIVGVEDLCEIRDFLTKAVDILEALQRSV